MMNFLRDSWLRGAKVAMWCAILVTMVLVRPNARALAQDRDTGKGKDKKEVVVKTPWGGFEASVTADAHALGLPVYPGAQLLKDKDSGPLHADLQISGKPSIKFVVGKFTTADSREKVRAFYQKELGKQVTKFTEKADDGSTEFEIKHKLDQQYVSVKTVGEMTQIDLVRIEGLETENGDKEDKK